MLEDHLALDLPMDPSAPAIARRAIERLGLSEVARDNALLLASELVSNAICHSGAPNGARIRFTARLGGGSLRITVSDRGRGFAPDDLRPEPGVRGGFGLFLVEQLAMSWGVERDGGTTVWLELPLVASAA
jgi:anti-sigma regulatory factor (Ser/Thr protein kinase)